MKHVLDYSVICVVSSLTLALFICSAASFAEDKASVETLYGDGNGGQVHKASGGDRSAEDPADRGPRVRR